MVAGFSSVSVGTLTLTVRKLEPDFSLSLTPSTVSGDRGTKVPIPIAISRVNGLTGNVTLALPDTLPPGIKPKPAGPITTSDTGATFKLKITGGATPGAYSLTITGRDDFGHTHAITFTLIVQ